MGTGEGINAHGLDVSSDYESCIDYLEHDVNIDGIDSTIRFHYLKFDGNGQPMVAALARMLYGYIIDYCIASRNRQEPLSNSQFLKLAKEARDLFRRPEISDDSPDKTGEAGEILLFVLLESVLNAPQLVSKMELKTNQRDEVKGSDGIHAKYDESTGLVEFYFGESKLYKKSSDAIAQAIKSVEQFHESKMYRHEFSMVNKHFKYADDKTRNELNSLIVSGEIGSGARINHACLIGYDFSGFRGLEELSRESMIDEFLDRFRVDGNRLVGLLQNRLDSFELRHLRFDVFFIPFPSVTDFRNAFNDALS